MKRENPKNNTMLCPLAGYTDAPFRALCAFYGAGITVTEMVSVKALAMNNSVTRELLHSEGEDALRAVQLFGSELAAYEKVLASGVLDDYDVIDLNMGCPVPKIVKNGEGSALMAKPQLAGEIVRTVKSFGKKVSVKFRLGITDDSLCLPFALAMQQSGADYITIHARTAKQMYAGRADWTALQRVVKEVTIPVYGNGDVTTRQQYLQMQEQTGCYGVGVGRAALGRPYIFAELLGIDYAFELIDALNYHVKTLLSYLPDRVVLNEIKKHIPCYLKGRKDVKKVIAAAVNSTTLPQLLLTVQEYMANSI